MFSYSVFYRLKVSDVLDDTFLQNLDPLIAKFRACGGDGERSLPPQSVAAL